jgi:hypothetical protein
MSPFRTVLRGEVMLTRTNTETLRRKSNHLAESTIAILNDIGTDRD